MSGAPLLRSSPVLGAPSYGALRDPDGSEEDTPVSRAPKVRGGLHRASFGDGIGSSSNVPGSTPRRSHSFVRQRNSLYAERNRRPSSAASDVGMGPDSKYSFATGLAVPGNPVMQETPASSPYMTSDDENVLDIDDDDSKSSDEDPPDNSPYAQVRASVPATDDFSLSINSRLSFWCFFSLYLMISSTSNVDSFVVILFDGVCRQSFLFLALSQCCHYTNHCSCSSPSTGQILGFNFQTNR